MVVYLLAVVIVVLTGQITVIFIVETLCCDMS